MRAPLEPVTASMVVVALAALSACASTSDVEAQRGRRIFTGGESATATVRGHATSLPPALAACNGCHAAAQERAPKGTYAPPLQPSWLLEPRQRRGGPPTSYDLASFCTVLRTGVDPASILVARVMPTYALDEAQCASLWTFLTNPR